MLMSLCEADSLLSRRCCCLTNLRTTVRRFYNTARVSHFLRAVVDLNALAWLEDYLQTWQGTLLVVYVAYPCHTIGIIEPPNPLGLTIVHSCKWVTNHLHRGSNRPIQRRRSNGHHPSTLRSPRLL